MLWRARRRAVLVARLTGAGTLTHTRSLLRRRQEELRLAFFKFATFGNRAVGNDEVLLDSRACQKLCKDSGLTSKKLTTTDIDLLFASVKPKGERKVDFKTFVQLVHLFAVKLERSHAEVVVMIASSAPKANPSAPAGAGWLGSGKELAAAGSRAAPAPGQPMPRIHPDWYEVKNPSATGESDAFYYVNRLTNETSWEVPLIRPTGTVRPPPPPSKPPGSVGSASPPGPGATAASRKYPSVAEPDTRESPRPRDKDAGARAASLRNLSIHDTLEEKSGGVPAKTSIFDRLTDPKLYTGAHKHRFDTDGRGRGLEGRDSMPKGAGATPASHAPRTAFKGHTNTGSDEKIDSIAQILRSK